MEENIDKKKFDKKEYNREYTKKHHKEYLQRNAEKYLSIKRCEICKCEFQAIAEKAHLKTKKHQLNQFIKEKQKEIEL